MTSALTPKQNPAWPAPPSTGLGGFPESIADEPRLLKPLHDDTSASFTIVGGGGGDGDDEGEVEHVLLLACPWTWSLADPLQNPESISDWNMSTKSCCSSSKLSCLYKSNSQRLLCCHSHIYFFGYIMSRKIRWNSHCHPWTIAQGSNWPLNYQNVHFRPWSIEFVVNLVYSPWLLAMWDSRTCKMSALPLAESFTRWPVTTFPSPPFPSHPHPLSLCSSTLFFDARVLVEASRWGPLACGGQPSPVCSPSVIYFLQVVSWRRRSSSLSPPWIHAPWRHRHDGRRLHNGAPRRGTGETTRMK
jgi:hypothetical protein